MKINIFAAIIILSVTGCGTIRPAPGIVAKEWSENTAQLGIKPIWPPRERIYPGDIYIATAIENPEQSDVPAYLYTISSQRFDSLNVSVAEEIERRRGSMPPMDEYSVESKRQESWKIPSYPSGGGRLNGLVAFPGFAFASVSESDIGLNITSGVWGALFGGGRKAQYSVSYSVPAAEYRSLPVRGMHELFRGYVNNLSETSRQEVKYIADSLTPKVNKKILTTSVIIVPSEVYYARAIDITVTTEDALGAKLSATAMSMIELSEKKSKLEAELKKLAKDSPSQNEGGSDALGNNQPGNEQASPSNSVQDPEEIMPPESGNKEAKAESLRSQISEIQSEITAISSSITPSIPGVTGSVTRVSTNGIKLTQSFYYPIAIGYKGLTYEVDDVLKGKTTPTSRSGVLLEGTISEDKMRELFP